jgi:hypothetical protein
MPRLLAWLLLIFGGLASSPAAAQPAGAPEPLRAKAEALIGVLNGKSEPERLFAKAFLAQVPPLQVKAISQQLTAQLGPARAVQRIEAKSAISGSVFIECERGTLQLELAVEPQPPHLIQGLLVVGTSVKGDSLTKIAEELKTLPGRTSLAVARLGDAAPALLASHEARRPMAVGSAFKLFILAELDRSIRAGERKWSDVVPLTHRSLPSGFLQDWPPGSQLTLQTLAALMISQSDNTATDTLLHLLGREKVEAMLETLGLQAPQRNRPFLSTMEAFALKGGDPALAKAWLAAKEPQRRALLAQLGRFGADRIDIARLNSKPNLIDSVEWFVSAEDLIRTLDWLRRNGSKEALEILAINPGIGRPAAAQFGYVGYKGGSETGVIAMSFLVRSRSGAWHAIAAAWNNPAAKVEEDKFVLLVSRAVALLPD